jgi:hypothetical protein
MNYTMLSKDKFCSIIISALLHVFKDVLKTVSVGILKEAFLVDKHPKSWSSRLGVI